MIHVIAAKETKSPYDHHHENNKESDHLMQQTYQSAGAFTRRIGNTNYRVKIHYCANENENLQEKVLRMIRNDIEMMAEAPNTGFQNDGICGTMDSPQTSRAA